MKNNVDTDLITWASVEVDHRGEWRYVHTSCWSAADYQREIEVYPGTTFDPDGDPEFLFSSIAVDR